MDLTLCKNLKKIHNLSWETLPLHGSDHHPIITKWGKNIQQTNRDGNKENKLSNKFNYSKADWLTIEEEAVQIDWESC